MDFFTQRLGSFMWDGVPHKRFYIRAISYRKSGSFWWDGIPQVAKIYLQVGANRAFQEAHTTLDEVRTAMDMPYYS